MIKGEVATPNARAHVERFIGSIRGECLNHFLLFGLTHLNGVLKTWLGYYHASRPHQGLENELLVVPNRDRRRKLPPEPAVVSLAEVRCKQQLGGLLKSYSLKAA